MDRSTYSTATKSGTFTESSIKTPNFHSLVKLKKRLPVKNYLWYRRDSVFPLYNTYNGLRTEMSVRGFWSMRDCISYGYLNTVAGDKRLPVQSQANAVSIVSNRLLSKVRNQDINLGVALGEYRQTAAFISTAMRKVAKSYKSLRKGNISAALRTLTGRNNSSWADIPNVSADMWLAYSYALRPLLSDVYGAAQALAKSKRPYVPVHVVRTAMNFPINGNVNVSGKFSSVKAQMRVSGQISYTVSNPLMKSLDGLGVLNPISVAWEKVPFSFVVDWFVPIGEFLTGIVPPQGVDFVDGWVYVKARGGCYHYTQSTGWFTDITSTEVYKQRIVLSSFPKHNLVVPDVSLSKEKIASGLALLWSLSGSSRPSGLRI